MAGLVSIHRQRNGELVAQTLEHRDQAAQFLGFGNPHGARTRGFRADVDDVGALLFQLDGVRESAVGIEEFSAVGKRVRRDVQDAHQQRPLAQLQSLIAELPFEALPKHAELRSSSQRHLAKDSATRSANAV